MVMKLEERTFIEVEGESLGRVLLRLNDISFLYNAELGGSVIGLRAGELIHTRLAVDSVVTLMRDAYESVDKALNCESEQMTLRSNNSVQKGAGETGENANSILTRTFLVSDEKLLFASRVIGFIRRTAKETGISIDNRNIKSVLSLAVESVGS